MKTCTKCKVEKPEAEFHSDKTRTDGLFPHCRECNAVACRAYRARNLERLQQYDRDRYHDDPARKADTIARTKRYREADPEKRKPSDRRYYEANKDRWLDYWHRRKARMANAEEIEKIDRGYIISRDRGICHLCGKQVPPDLIELDHLVPISKGGNHTKDNLRVSCRHCNRVRNHGRLPAQLLIFG